MSCALQKSAVSSHPGDETQGAQGAGVRPRVLVGAVLWMNTEFRKQAKNEFEKNFYRFMNNSMFRKTTENMQKRVNIKIVCSDEKEKI